MSTIADVAKESGVSVATVSRVINESDAVLPETKERVLFAIKKLEYQPNEWGRRLRRKESRMILVFIPNIRNPYYAAIVSGIEDFSRQNRYGVMLCITNDDDAREKEFFELLRSGQADGAIFLATKKDDTSLHRLIKNYPIVQCCEYTCKDKVPHVSINNFAAAEQMVDYLISIGHRKVGFIGSKNSYISSEQRRSGFRSALERRGIEVREAFLTQADENYTFFSAVQVAKQLLSRPERPTALFCISDVIALGAVRAASELGLRAPEDVSIAGFDDVDYASMLSPMLTTIQQPGRLLGKTSAEMLIDWMKTGCAPESLFLEHRIILRDSTTSPK